MKQAQRYDLVERTQRCHMAILEDSFIRGCNLAIEKLISLDMPSYVITTEGIERVPNEEVDSRIAFWIDKIQERKREIIHYYDIEEAVIN